MLRVRNTVRTDSSGWTWLEPHRSSLILRQAVVAALLSLLLIAAAAAATLPPPVVAVPLLACILGIAGLLVRYTWRETHTRLGVSALGLHVQQGTHLDHIGWPAVAAIVGTRRHRRVDLTITTLTGVLAVRTSFSTTAARDWLDVSTTHARSRRLEPIDAADRLHRQALGFFAADSA